MNSQMSNRFSPILNDPDCAPMGEGKSDSQAQRDRLLTTAVDELPDPAQQTIDLDPCRNRRFGGLPRRGSTEMQSGGGMQRLPDSLAVRDDTELSLRKPQGSPAPALPGCKKQENLFTDLELRHPGNLLSDAVFCPTHHHNGSKPAGLTLQVLRDGKSRGGQNQRASPVPMGSPGKAPPYDDPLRPTNHLLQVQPDNRGGFQLEAQNGPAQRCHRQGHHPPASMAHSSPRHACTPVAPRGSRVFQSFRGIRVIEKPTCCKVKILPQELQLKKDEKDEHPEGTYRNAAPCQ